MINSTTLCGNITRAPEIRTTQTGVDRCWFTLAVNRKWRDRNGEEQEDVSFIPVICWDKLATNAAASLDKGDRVVVTGRTAQRNYNTDSGEQRSVVEVVAMEVAPSLRWSQATLHRNAPTDQAATAESAHAPF